MEIHRKKVDRFIASVQEHVNIGRQILEELCESPIIRPQALAEAWADWLIVGDMLGMLHQGITILEAPRHSGSAFPILSDSTSGVRQWAGFSSLL